MANQEFKSSKRGLALQEESRLDGCYVIKTDLPKSAAPRNLFMAGIRIWLLWRRPLALVNRPSWKSVRSISEMKRAPEAMS